MAETEAAGLVRAWLAAQLADPTNGLHAMGFCTLATECVKHWISGHPVDGGTIAAAMGCFVTGGVMDYSQAKLAK